LAHIFEEHFRASTATAVPGSGIGMTLVRELVDLLGGRIEVRSPVSHGRGTRITVFLPEMEAAEEERPI
jgi:two-component system sensor histidine kinase MprB